MGFNPTFYASRPKLSEVTIDSDLNMGGRNILRVGRVDSPYMPETWPIEELDWGDGEPVTSVGAENLGVDTASSYKYTPLLTADAPCEIVVRLVDVTGYALNAPVITLADKVAVRTGTVLYPGDSYTFEPVILNTGDVLKIGVRRLSTTGAGSGIISRVELINTGRVVGDTTLDLSGKWLALGIDMQGLSATVKIQGVEMPYSDYVKCFPLAPSEITISGTWTATQIRPIVGVYK